MMIMIYSVSVDTNVNCLCVYSEALAMLPSELAVHVKKLFFTRKTSSTVGPSLGECGDSRPIAPISVEGRDIARRSQKRSREPPEGSSRLASTSQPTVHNHSFTELFIHHICWEKQETGPHIRGQYVV